MRAAVIMCVVMLGASGAARADQMHVNPRDGAVYLGERRLSLDEMLTLGGATHIKDRMRTRRWIRRGMLGTGLAIVATGAVVVFTARSCEDVIPTDRRECEDERSARKATGAVIAGVGLVVAVLHTTIRRGQPGEDELREIIRNYNRGSTAVTPLAVPGGGGLALTVRF